MDSNKNGGGILATKNTGVSDEMARKKKRDEMITIRVAIKRELVAIL